MSKSVEDLAKEAIDKYFEFNGMEEAKEEKEVTGPEFEETKLEKTLSDTTYSSLFGWNEEQLGKQSEHDFNVKVFSLKDWNEDDVAHIPDAKLYEDRVIDHEVMYPFVLAMQPEEGHHADKVMLVGPTGSGKTTLAEYYCAKVNQPFLRINGRQDLESDSIIGMPWLNNGNMEFNKGEIPKAMEAGWFVLFDEPMKIPAGIQMTLQRMMEKGGILQLDNMAGNLDTKQIIPDPRHRFVLADNVVGTGDNVDKYGATMIQDSSFLNRVDMLLKVDYLPMDAEVNLVMKKFPRIPEYKAQRMIRLLNLLRKGFDQGELSSPASLRNIEAWGQKAVQVESYARSFRWVLLNRYADASEAATVRDFYFQCFGEKL
jgi:cobaltochelatase CobS